MTKPICCGRPATPYKKEWNKGSFYIDHKGRIQSNYACEEGFRCKKCGRIRIPYGPPLDDSKYQAEILAIKLRLIAEGELDMENAL